MWVTKIKASPYWYVRFDHPEPGFPVVSISTKCTTKRQAIAHGREIEERFKNDWEKRKDSAPKTVSQVIDQYWETDARRLKAAKTHIFPHLDRIDRMFGSRLYHDITIADVAKLVDWMQDRNYSPATINRALSVWRRMHNVAAKTRLYPVREIDWGHLRKDEPPPRDANLTRDQLHAIFDALPPRAREIAMFGLLTGLRKGQVLTLTWDRIDLDEGTVTVFRKHRKAEARHTVPIHAAALRILNERRRLANNDLVFDQTNFAALWASAVAKAGRTGQVRFHDLRHAFATIAAQRMPLHLVQTLLGHSDIKVTMRYSHARASDMRDGLRQLPGFGKDQ